MPTLRRTSVRVRGPDRRMSSVDAGFLYLERSHAPLHIGCIAIVEGALSAAALASRVGARIDRMRRYAERAVPVPLALAHPTWEPDPDFEPREHVYRWSLPSPGGERELCELLEELVLRPLDRGRPLWEMHLIEGLADGRTAVFQKVHHCMIDGVAGAQLLDVLLDETPVARERFGLLEAPRPLPGGGERVRRALGDGLRRQLSGALGVARALSSPLEARRASERLSAAAWSALRLAASDVPRLPWNEPVSHRRRLHFTALPLEGVQLVRRRRSGTVNDVVLSVLAGGLHRYLRALGIETRGLEAVALVPVSLRTSEEAGAMGNRISAMLVPLAVDPEGELARLAATRAITERLKSGAAWTGIDSLLRALDGLPAPLVALAGSRLSLGRIANLVATNVPGPRGARWLCGRRVEALRPIVPIADGLGLGAAVLSYDGTLSVGLNADPSLLPDLEKLGHGIEEAFTALTSAG
jgi:WS/DGAT/MGAT family acyltransferase